jgi:hypothetical protein
MDRALLLYFAALFDLNGEASIARTKQISAISAPT